MGKKREKVNEKKERRGCHIGKNIVKGKTEVDIQTDNKNKCNEREKE
jgi:hypothetical protein